MSKPKQQAQRPVCAACGTPIPVGDIARFQGQRYHRAGTCVVLARARDDASLSQAKDWLEQQKQQRRSLVAEQKALQRLIIRSSSRDVLGWLLLKERAQEVETALQSGTGISQRTEADSELDGQFLGFLPSERCAEFRVSAADAPFRQEIVGQVITAQVAPDLDESVGINKVLQQEARITVHTHWTDSSDPQHTITHASFT